MRKILISLCALFAVSACQTSSEFGAGTTDRHSILIAADESAPGSLHRDSRITGRVLNAMSGQISDRGFSVFDVTALDVNHDPMHRAPRDEAAILEAVRAGHSLPVDTIALFTIHADSRLGAGRSKVRVRVAARLMDASSGQHLGNFEVAEVAAIRPRCDGPCYTAAIGDVAQRLGRETASVLAQKLGVRVSRNQLREEHTSAVRGLTLVFDDFSAAELLEIQEYLAIFSGYRSHRPIASFHRHAEIWYDSAISAAKLRRNLDRMLTEMGLQARIAFRGNTYMIRQVKIPLSARRKVPAYKW